MKKQKEWQFKRVFVWDATEKAQKITCTWTNGSLRDTCEVYYRVGKQQHTTDRKTTTNSLTSAAVILQLRSLAVA